MDSSGIAMWLLIYGLDTDKWSHEKAPKEVLFQVEEVIIYTSNLQGMDR